MGIEGTNNFDELNDKEREKVANDVYDEWFGDKINEGDLLPENLFKPERLEKISESPESIEDVNAFLNRTEKLIKDEILKKNLKEALFQAQNFNDDALAVSMEISTEGADFVFSPKTIGNKIETGKAKILKTIKNTQIRGEAEEITLTSQIWSKEKIDDGDGFEGVTTNQQITSEGSTVEEAVSLALEAVKNIARNSQEPTKGTIKENGNLELESSAGFFVKKMQIIVAKEAEKKFKVVMEAEIFI